MAVLIALFAAFASAIVLLRLSLDESLGTQTGHVMYPLALGTLAASLAVIAAAAVTSLRRKRIDVARSTHVKTRFR